MNVYFTIILSLFFVLQQTKAQDKKSSNRSEGHVSESLKQSISKTDIPRGTQTTTRPTELKRVQQTNKQTTAITFHQLSPSDQYKAQKQAEKKEVYFRKVAIYQRYLGLSSATDAQYAAKKEALFNNNPEAYQQMSKELQELHQPSKSPHVVYRSKYNKLSAEERKKIDSQPELYIIID